MTPIRTLSIGGAAFDLFLHLEKTTVEERHGERILTLPLGHKLRLDTTLGTGGGGANNTSVGLKRLGCDSKFLGILSDDQWGQFLQQQLKQEGVDITHATITEKEMSSFSVILSATDGERVILNHPGTAKHLLDATFDREAIATVDAVFLNHIHRESQIIEDDIIAALQSAPQVQLIWNPGGCQIENGLAAPRNSALTKLCFLLILNKEEALAFTGDTTVEAALKTLSKAGAQNICITDGPNGCDATDGKEVFHCPALPCTVVDMTGAGDAFGCGVMWGLLCGKDLPTSLRAGTINAMSVVCAMGAQAGLLTETQIETALTSR